MFFQHIVLQIPLNCTTTFLNSIELCYNITNISILFIVKSVIPHVVTYVNEFYPFNGKKTISIYNYQPKRIEN